MAQKSKAHRPFEITPEFEENSKELINKYVDAKKSGSDKEKEALEKLFRLAQSEREKQERLYEPNPPNHKSRHAVLTGLLIENLSREYQYNSEGEIYHSAIQAKRVYPIGEIPLLESPFEKASIWTRDLGSDSSSLVVEVNADVKQEKWWKTLASCLRISFSLNSTFETIPDTKYNWIYYFDPLKNSDEQKFLYNDHFEIGTFDGYIKTPDDFAFIAPTLELLIRDEAFFTAAQNLLISFENHYFCVSCELRSGEYKDHPNHEPEIWEIAPLIPKMEAAIVQAIRACEGLLGKPGKNRDRAISRWISRISLDPDKVFDSSGKSYFETYLDLFSVRGEAAHNLGNFPYELSRKMAIQSQLFSFQILKSYYKTHRLCLEDALKSINFNQELLSPLFIEKNKIKNQ